MRPIQLHAWVLLLAAVGLHAQGLPLEQVLKNGVKRPAPAKEAPAASPTVQQAKPRPPASASPSVTAGTAGSPRSAQLPFSFQLAPGWQARFTQDNAALASSADGASTVAVLPVMGIGSASPSEWMRQHGATLLARYLPNATLDALYPSRLGRSGLLATISFARGQQTGKGSVMLFSQDGMGTLYLMGAPASRFLRDQPTMLAMLRSFRFQGERSGAANTDQRPPPPEPSYIPFRDPHEGAFTLDVPSNWKIEGGVVRRSEVDINTYVRATSPNGIVVTLGDEYIPRFIVPTATLASLGMGEGGRYSPFPGNVLIVQRYLPGAVYAHHHVASFAQRMGLTSPRIEQPRDRRELFKQLPSIGLTTTGGDVRFRARRGSMDYEGYVLAATSLMMAPGQQDGGIWYVQSLVSYVTPPGGGDLASAVVARMLSSIRMNPQWVAQQRQTSAETYRQVKETNDYIAGLFRETREHRQQIQDRQQREFGDIIRGVVRLRDTETGEVFEGKAGNNYYWRVRHSDTLIGSDLHSPPPNIDLTELEQLR
ncbi:MAG: hypothetical protein MUF01_03660 [Bryobacterales bacterium]|jgi:hypothetical protein|nr:hypothetical protein [Bryobacterales bacterium]